MSRAARYITLIVLASVSLALNADSQRIIDYQYDGAGNIIGIRSGRNLAPPNVTLLSPAFVNLGSSVTVTATGINLLHADVSTTATGVSISSVTTTETSVRFLIAANDIATLGPALLTFTTRLGTDTAATTVAERTPVISTDPNPIVLAPDGQPVTVKLVFEAPFLTDQIYDLLVRDTTIASVSQTSITLPAGQTQVSTSLTGLLAGTTALEINQLANFIALGIPVVVNNNQLPAATYGFYAKPVGVSVYLEQTVQTSGVFTSQPVGVAAYIEQQVAVDGIYVTHPVGASLGTVVDQITPQNVLQGTAPTLTLTGFELGAVTAIAFIPADGITQTGPFTVAPDGRQLDIPIDVATTAPIGPRILSLTTPLGEVLVSMPLIIE